MHESKPPSDALVFFGATGDLAYKKIFPALQSLTRRGRLNVPVIGVAFSGWNRDQLIARAKASCTEYGGLDPAAFEKLSANLRYVDGDYKDPKTFERLKSELGKAKRPTQYLAIPPSMFTTVAEGLAQAGAAEDARVVVEKPFGRDLASARELNQVLHRFLKNRCSASTTTWARKRCRTFSTSASRTRFLSRSSTATTSRTCRSRSPRASA
jgi:glucose-6-phosphate 1-dehydrogenase